jgi:hypothetical protein
VRRSCVRSAGSVSTRTMHTALAALFSVSSELAATRLLGLGSCTQRDTQGMRQDGPGECR